MNRKLLIISSLSFIFLQSCTKETKEATKSEQFCLTDSLVKNLETVSVTSETIKNELKISGKVAPYESRQVNVEPLVNGIIEDLKTELGDYVQKGQVVAVVRSTEVAGVENDIIAAKSNLLSAQKNLTVSQELAKAGLATEKEVVLAKNELLKAESELKKANDVSGIYGIKNSQYTLKSPISGYVVDRNLQISEKMSYRLEEIGPFYTIANLSEVQVVANVYETDIAKVKLGYVAKVRLLAYPDKIFTGKIDKIYNVLDPETRTMKVRINLANPNNILKPEMFAEVFIDFQGDNKMMTVPAEAVIFDKNKSFVMVYKDKCNIETRSVKVFQTTGGKSYISSGVAEGDKIMKKYQLLVYDALND